jgi:hypothetical protein
MLEIMCADSPAAAIGALESVVHSGQELGAAAGSSPLVDDAVAAEAYQSSGTSCRAHAGQVRMQQQCW